MSWAQSYNRVEVAPPPAGRRGVGSTSGGGLNDIGRSSTYHPGDAGLSRGTSGTGSFSRRANATSVGGRTPGGGTRSSDRSGRHTSGAPGASERDVHSYGGGATSATPTGQHQTLQQQLTAEYNAKQQQQQQNASSVPNRRATGSKDSLSLATATYSSGSGSSSTHHQLSTADRLQQPRRMPSNPRLNRDSISQQHHDAANTEDDSPEANAATTRAQKGPSPPPGGRGPLPTAGAGTSNFANRLRKDVSDAPHSPETSQGGSHPLSRHTSFGSFKDLPRQDSMMRGANNSSYYQGLIGFSNLGNTCFMNSTLQCVLRLRALRSCLIEQCSPSKLKLQFERKTPVTAALHDLASQVFVGSGPNARGSVAPQQVKSAIGAFHRAFDGYDQHDAQELLRYLLDAMDIECCRLKKKPPYEELKDIDGEPIDQTAGRWLRNHMQRNASFVQDVFCGQFVSTTVCLTCTHVSTSCDVFHDLSLPIVKGRRSTSSSLVETGNLNDCLSSFFGEFTLDPQEHQYICGKCKKPQKAVRNTKLMKCPDVLVIHLKRFRQQRFLRTKIADVVTFPVDEGALSMSTYLHKTSPEENVCYSLSGIVNHMGSCHGGHYTAYGKSGAGGSGWYEFNDSRVESVSNPDKMVSGSAYLLFYERIKSNKL